MYIYIHMTIPQLTHKITALWTSRSKNGRRRPHERKPEGNRGEKKDPPRAWVHVRWSVGTRTRYLNRLDRRERERALITDKGRTTPTSRAPVTDRETGNVGRSRLASNNNIILHSSRPAHNALETWDGIVCAYVGDVAHVTRTRNQFELKLVRGRKKERKKRNKNKTVYSRVSAGYYNTGAARVFRRVRDVIYVHGKGCTRARGRKSRVSAWRDVSPQRWSTNSTCPAGGYDVNVHTHSCWSFAGG